jgi:nucleotide-binding universal stress UspA family protein
MKNIIVPTDFSVSADNALRYAIVLAKQLKAKLHVVYAYNTDVIVQPTSIDVDNPTFVQIPIPQDDYKKMDAVEKELSNYPGLIYECYIKEGFIDDMLVQLAEKEKSGLMVIGTQGAHDRLSLWTDNNTVTMIERKKISVLSVPESFTGNLASKSEFILATDFGQINDWSIMDPFYELALKLNANVNVFYVKDEDAEGKDLNIYEKETFGELVAFFKGVHVSLHHSLRNNIVNAIDEFAKFKNASLVMMVSHERGWLEDLFHHSVTKDMTLHGHVPLLTIPDKAAELNQSYSTGYW